MNTGKDDNGRSTPYNGWTNYETWNVSQWLTGTPDNYELCLRHVKAGNSYVDIAVEMNRRGIMTTPDNVDFWSERIDVPALDAMLSELTQ